MRYDNVVWDWNGALLDDISISVRTINEMLGKRSLALLTSESYREVFGFPVKNYYETVGFDFVKEDWDQVSMEYVTTYEFFTPDADLTDGVQEVLSELKDRGVKQYVLSALKEDLLHDMLERFGIKKYFEGICGSDNIYADGKIGRGKSMLQNYPIHPVKTLMIGDTLHDAEVARSLGFDCLLYTRGHNSTERLCQHEKVIHHLREIPLWMAEMSRKE